MTLTAKISETVALPSVLTIRTVQITKDAVLAGFSAAESIVLDVPQDADCDLSFIQVVESARLFAQSEEKEITLLRPASGGLLAVLERGGFLTDIDPSDRFFWLHERHIQ
ncbi:STAS domain-containing protein [Rhizobium oryziradicis]|uniref:STAS domain-containing protein n=1 Tax=Rhizobium oryziradicis TaxID=1867956 RepID=UPI0009F8937D|nr:STAS domain-containing protein [Rhizobium oryziradicis]